MTHLPRHHVNDIEVLVEKLPQGGLVVYGAIVLSAGFGPLHTISVCLCVRNNRAIHPTDCIDGPPLLSNTAYNSQVMEAYTLLSGEDRKVDNILYSLLPLTHAICVVLVV